MSEPSALPDISVLKTSPQRFINRELSWLNFNGRVLEEAWNEHHPLLERVKFLAISSSNLDEFSMVRVAGLKEQVRHGISRTSRDGLSPSEQLIKIYDKVAQLTKNQQECWLSLRSQLEAHGVFVINPKHLTEQERTWLHNYFTANIFPTLTPLAIDPAHPFPFMPNLGIANVFKLQHQGDKKILNAIIPVPHNLDRFIRLPGSEIRYIMLEDILELYFADLFPHCKIQDSGTIRIIRDSDLEIQDDAEDLVQQFESALKQRRLGSVMQLKVNASISKELRNFVMDELGVDPEDVIEVDGIIGLSSLTELLSCGREDLKFTPFEQRFPERITDYGGDCFAAIQAKDFVVHHPYESFDVVVKFLRQAAHDPNVVAIKQTLYRTSSDSPIVKALIEAAEAGKSVTAVVELSARFDEEANIRWARDLEHVGAQVIFGFVNTKTHAKVSLVVRRTDGTLKSYVHFGTGNYHPVTARTYSDLSFFTCDPALCLDASYLFNYLTGYAPPEKFSKISVAPLNLRGEISALIEHEISLAQQGKPASIYAKLNSLVDDHIIDLLYRASQAGVKIDLVVRGVCCLRPGIPGLSENIKVKSIVGRFLEHARIYCFGNGHKLPSPYAKVYISSADWMHRNLNRRIEVMIPIENPTVHEQILDQIMMANFKDKKQSWVMHPDGNYIREVFDEHSFSAHDYFIKNPSLSGRGKALKKIKPSTTGGADHA